MLSVCLVCGVYLGVALVALLEEHAQRVVWSRLVQQQQFASACRDKCRNVHVVEAIDKLEVPDEEREGNRMNGKGAMHSGAVGFLHGRGGPHDILHMV